jgi:hypothetical protein
MTEAEWLACADPTPMLEFLRDEFLRDKVSDRKHRLIATACCRRVWHLVKHERSRAAVEVSEAVAEGTCTLSDAEINSLNQEVVNARWGFHEEPVEMFAATAVEMALPRLDTFEASWFLRLASKYAVLALEGEQLRAEGATPKKLKAWAEKCEHSGKPQGRTKLDATGVIAAILRDIIGNPFRPVSFDPSWLTSTVVALARGIYEERAFDRLPILADALQDAGCDSDDILNHLRDPHATHVRGCWALDLVLGKE